MSDITSGQNAEHWKQKYYDQLDLLDKREKEWADLESLLKRTIGRLSLAAEGHHKSLDRHIQDIRSAVKETINRHRLEGILEDLSSLLTKIEEKQKAPDHQVISVLESLVENLQLPPHCDKSRKKIIKELSKATDDDGELLVRDIVSLLQQAITLQPESAEKRTGFLGRLLGSQTTAQEHTDIHLSAELAGQIIAMFPWPADLSRDAEALINKTHQSKDVESISNNISQLEQLIAKWKQQIIPDRDNSSTTETPFVRFIESMNQKKQDREFSTSIDQQQSYDSRSGDDIYLLAYKACMLNILDKMDNPASPDGRIAALRLSARDADEKKELDRLTADLAELLYKTKPLTDIHQAAEHDSEQPQIQELLIRLLEQLVVPVELHNDVEAMKTRLEAEDQPADWKQLLKEVALLINSIRSRMQQEKHEFEDFLQQITTRLKELDNFLQSETETWKQAEEAGKAFDDSMNLQVQDIRDDVTKASDLQQLKSVVENRLDIISQHILKYRQNEAQRHADAQKNAEDMQTKMQSLEKQTEKLKIAIIEKNKQAISDTLTGIPNRLAFEQRISVEVARWKRFGNPLSLAVWDVDFFKRVNDTYGHKAGDKVLRTIAQLLSKRIRQTDFIARYGGEEFVMLLPGTKEEETLRLVNELRKQVEECGFHYHGKGVTITVSCGVSSFRENDTVEQVFERADKALYKAKKNGRNQCVIASVRSD